MLCTHVHTHTHRESESLIIYRKYPLNYSLAISTATSVNFSSHVQYKKHEDANYCKRITEIHFKQVKESFKHPSVQNDSGLTKEIMCMAYIRVYTGVTASVLCNKQTVRSEFECSPHNSTGSRCSVRVECRWCK